MADRPLLFTKLRLRNYKLHADTEVRLDRRPILLVTGANGSGKTQVLEALRLCLGVHPSPSRARGMASVIGPRAKDAHLTLHVRNPVVDGHRLLKPPHEDLANVLDHDVVRVRARVAPSGSVQYRIGGAEDPKAGHRVSGRQLRDVFRSVNVQAGNRLAFTEEGMVDVFAGESGRKKLESLLEATGRLQYLEDLRQALAHLADATRQAEPLRQKLQWERELVASIRERLEIIRDRTKYIEQHAALCTEHAWAVVRDLEAARDALVARIERTEARLDRRRASLRDAQDALGRARADIEERTRASAETRETIQREKATLERLVGQRLRLQEELAEAKAQLARLEEEREDLRRILARQQGEADAARFQECQRELVGVEHEMSRLLREVESLEAQAQEEDAEALGSPDSALPPQSEMTRCELEMVDACASFATMVAEQGMEGAIVGPVISLVGIRAGEEAWERAVRRLAGRHLFAFVARDRQAYAEAKALFDRLFPDRKPPITVVRHAEAEASAQAPRLPSGVHALAAALVEGDRACLAFFRRVVRGAVAHSEADPNQLTDFAESERRPVLSADCSAYYTSFGGFTRPPMPIVTALGTPLLGAAQEASGAARAPRLEARQRDLLRRHAQLALRARELERELGTSSVRPQVRERLRTVEERVESLAGRIEQMTAQDGRLLHQIQVLNNAVNELVRNEEPLAADAEGLRAQAREAESEVVRCTTLIDEEQKVLARFGDERQALCQQLAAAQEEAEKLGKRPPEVRATELVAQEKSEVKGKLDAIVGQKVDEDNLRRKEEELEELEAYVQERTAHIERLQGDVAERREVWQREVRGMVEHLSMVMQMLLRDGAFRDVRLEVAHVEDPEKAELAIRARTKGVQWLDYRELSGGEKVLCTEALIMSLHTMSDSPVHAIDEFTQRLDKSNAAAAFDIVRKTFEMTARHQPRLVPQFVLLCPEAFGLEDNALIHHVVLVEARLRGARKQAAAG
ncbi:MAG: AAA family ATPase [Candidatus Brocadiia bacterium]